MGFRFDKWEIIGMGAGGATFIPTISPHNSDIVVEACDMTGAYITYNGGVSWRMFNLRTKVSVFAFDSNNPKVIYAGNVALWRSEDTGKTWSMVFPDLKKNTIEHMRGDHADYILTTDDISYPKSVRTGWITNLLVEPIASNTIYITGILVDPNNSNNIYIVFNNNLLYFSEDYGITWMKLKEFEDRVITMYIRPDKERNLYILGKKGIYIKIKDNWQFLEGPKDKEIQGGSIGLIKETGKLLIYIITQTQWEGKELEGGVYVSEDNGRSWRLSNTDLLDKFLNPGEGKSLQFEMIVCSSNDALKCYVEFYNMRSKDKKDKFWGTAKTEVGGKKWEIVYMEGADWHSSNLKGGWIEYRAVNQFPWLGGGRRIDVAPNNPDVFYITDTDRTYRTTDGGKKWQQVYCDNVGEGKWRSRGLDVTTCYGVHFDPFDENRIYISYTDVGLWQSFDKGESWINSINGIPRNWINTTYWLAFDPGVKGLVWGVFSQTHDLPRPKMWRGRNPSTYQGGVAVSRDGGLHWSISNEGMEETAATHILLDSDSPVGNRTLYVCGFGKGVYKSIDNGKSWVLKNKGIGKKQPFVWRIIRANEGTLYLIVARRSNEGKIGDEDDGALYKSNDGAESWIKMKLPEGVNGPTGLGIDPLDNKRMYLTTWGIYSSKGDTGGGVYLSTDGGSNWENIFNEGQHVYDITIDNNNPNILYICGFDASAYRSEDRGKTWKRIKGYNFKWGHRVIVDPVNSDMIYITTFGGSVWYGPAKGDINAIEDIITPIPIKP